MNVELKGPEVKRPPATVVVITMSEKEAHELLEWLEFNDYSISDNPKDAVNMLHVSLHEEIGQR